MRAWISITLSLCAAYVVAQDNGTAPTGANAFSIPEGQSSYVVSAGGTVDLAWGNLEGDFVTIKLQANDRITPESGIVLADSIANTGSTSVTIPEGSEIPPGAYTFQILEDGNENNYNFAPAFSVAGASGTGSFGPSASGSATTSSDSASVTPSASTSSGSSSSTTSGTASRTSSEPSSETSETASNTGAPDVNAGWKKQAPLAAAVIIGAAAVL